MSAGIQIIGDEIHHNGELVAILTTNPAPTALGAFTDALEECGEADHSKVLDELEKQATEKASGGLLRMPDLARIIAQLKEG